MDRPAFRPELRLYRPAPGGAERRYDWFEKTGRPGFVLWWVTDGTIPTWQDGVPRLEYLQDHEPTEYGFTFDHPFTPEGTPTRLDSRGPRHADRPDLDGRWSD
jgi:hypothetical protein